MLDTLELTKLKENHVYKFLKFKYSLIEEKKLLEVNQQELLHNIIEKLHQVELSMDKQELEDIHIFSILEVNNVTKKIKIMSIGKLT